MANKTLKHAAFLMMCAVMTFLMAGCAGNPQQSSQQGSKNMNTEQSESRHTSSSQTEDYSYTTKEIWVAHENRKIYGTVYLPEKEGKLPTVIFSHELGNNHESGIPYAERLAAAGYAVYTFDYPGGSTASAENKSDGVSTEMSVMTEASDLQTVITAAKTWKFSDPEKLVVLGASQGGFAAAVTAAADPEEIAGLMLLYPAFVIYDNMHREFETKDNIPETFGMWGGWINLGRIYAADVWDYDPYEHIGNYTGKVLLLHGDSDSLVPLSYSEHAHRIYQTCEFHVIENGGHGFTGQPFEDAMKYILNYMKNIAS